MTRSEYAHHLKDILAFDSLATTLSIASRYWLHREIIANYTSFDKPAITTKAPSASILKLSAYIKRTKWERPQLRYNAYRELEEYNGEDWEAFNTKNKTI